MHALLAMFVAAPVALQGAGATFPEGTYRRWFAEYEKANPGVVFRYEASGSSAGARKLLEGAVDFAASDPPLPDDVVARTPGLVHVPAFVGAVAVGYNLLTAGELHLTAELLSAIFRGKVVRWNDPLIAKVNIGMRLPDLPIKVVTRGDASGTTQVFTGYLSKERTEFAREIGTGSQVRWPVGQATQGSDGLAKAVSSTEGAIGYVELSHARSTSLGIASIQNAAGTFVQPTSRTISRAAVGVRIPEDFRASLVSAQGFDAYPIATFTYLILDRERLPSEKRAALAGFLEWALHDGQRFVAAFGNAPLPGLLVRQLSVATAGLR